MYSSSNQREKVTLLQQIKYLICQGSDAIQIKKMIHCIEEMFDPNFRQAMNKNPKRYVPFSTIFQQENFTNFLNLYGLCQIRPDQYDIIGSFLHIELKNHSKILWSYPGGARRMHPYEKQVKAVYFEDFPFKDVKEQFQALIYQRCNVFQIMYDDYLQWAIVYTDDQDALMELNGYEWIDDEDCLETDREQRKYKLRVCPCQDVERLEETAKNSLGQNKFDQLYRCKSTIKYPCLLSQSAHCRDKMIQKGYEADEDLHQSPEAEN